MHRLSRSLALALLLACAAFAQNVPASLRAEVASPFTFVAYGDVRFLNPSNTKDSDPVRRRLIVNTIAEQRPAFVLFSGDVVATGADASQWAVFDQETAPLRESGISIYPTLGNHDLRGDQQSALDNYFQRFPLLKRSRWYSLRAGNLLVLAIDSSLDQMEGDQMRWVQQQIDSLPRDVEFVIFNMHHPPYTHSSDTMPGGGHAERPSEESVAHMLERRQQTAHARFIVFSGHVHNYERYEHGGVTYVVSGGGGATPYEVPRAEGDAYRMSGPTYHYCLLTVERGKLSLRMMKLESTAGRGTWAERDSFALAAK